MFNFLEMASGSSYCTALIDVWKGNVKKARILTGLLRDELYSVSDFLSIYFDSRKLISELTIFLI